MDDNVFRAPGRDYYADDRASVHRSTVRSWVVDGNGFGSKFIAGCGSFAVLVRREIVCCAANSTWGGKTSGERSRCELSSSTESTGSW